MVDMAYTFKKDLLKLPCQKIRISKKLLWKRALILITHKEASSKGKKKTAAKKTAAKPAAT